MKKTAILLLLFLAGQLAARAQQTAPPGYVLVDSLIFTPLAAVDSTLDGSSIFSVMPSNVSITQSGAIRNAIEMRARSNSSRQVSGYRIRIFFDNGQDARGASEAALYRFKVQNPGISAYRSFSNPYFKVTVGDFRNKSEAMAALASIKQQFPSAFIVQEKFRYPALENRNAYRVDTLKVLRKVN
ncbi:MAG: SPOR domain-containing protein [Bacteroidales bacterium]|nr:SPOR domain-containing protein [Bacteroidales bacterium]